MAKSSSKGVRKGSPKIKSTRSTANTKGRKAAPVKRAKKKVTGLSGKKASAVKRSAKLTGVQIALDQSLEDQRLWSTLPGGVLIDHFLDLKRARKWVKAFNSRTQPIPKSIFMQPENFDKNIFLELLNRPEVKYLRVYFGLNEHKRLRLLFVGADELHNDIYINRPSAGKGATFLATQSDTGDGSGSDNNSGVIDFGQGCPSYGNGDIVMMP